MKNSTEELKRHKIIGKMKEYEIKITKMAGYLADYHIDRAIESDDFSDVSSFLIDYFSAGTVGKSFDVGYLYTKYKEYNLDEIIEDIDFDIIKWYKINEDFNSIDVIKNTDDSIYD